MLADYQIEQIGTILSQLSDALDGLPVVASQQGDVIQFAGASDPLIAERLARVADRAWRDGAAHIAREVIRFEEEVIEEIERANYVVYSIHVADALTLTVGWQTTISLTQLRAEVSDAKAQIARALR
jgi:predicted regulator of Ras-like GTPase activity (Roadblock/LC7/MglB family)